MATTGNKLSLTYKDSDYNNMTMSYNYADPDVTTAAVQALATGIITNGSIFDKTPIAAVKAEIIQTQVRSINLNS